VVVKKRLAGILNEVLDPIRTRREELAHNPKHVMDILREGTLHARKTAALTLDEVKTTMKINYFA
jgi:tryptophanyl-tRNA synthetase